MTTRGNEQTTGNDNRGKRALSVRYCGRMDYTDAWALQQELHKKRAAEIIPDTLLLLEHPHVITLGTRGTRDDIVADDKTLQAHNVGIVKTTRGGQVTLHSPGQLVGYCIFHLYRKQRAIRQFIAALEAALIDALDSFGISAQSGEHDRGVWVGAKKIASIGISVSGGITMHGFALNVSNTLDAFSWIVACGVQNASVTGIARERKRNHMPAPTMTDVCTVVVDALATHMPYSDIIKNTQHAPGW